LPEASRLDPWSLSLDPLRWRLLPPAAARERPSPPEFADVIGQVRRCLAPASPERGAPFDCDTGSVPACPLPDAAGRAHIAGAPAAG
jgi:hypothetical protein